MMSNHRVVEIDEINDVLRQLDDLIAIARHRNFGDWFFSETAKKMEEIKSQIAGWK